jgi:hypothetical protein
MIAKIKNDWLRRAAILAYLPFFVTLCAILLVLGFIYQIALYTREQCCGFVWEEIVDCWRLFRRTWARADS